MNELDRQIETLCAQWDGMDSPGCVVGVSQDGELRYAHAFGMADLERDVPLTPASVFDIGSTGKQFTAALIAMLARRGALSLEDEVQKYVPELPVYLSPITIRHLLHHTSGIRDYLGLMTLAGWPAENTYSEDTLLRLIARQEALNFRPGDEFLYSNSGYLLLGVVAQRVTGKSLRQLLRDEIFEPLGMGSTDTNDDASRIVKARALSYTPAAGGYRFEPSPSTGFGDGPVLTTAEDLCRWDANFYANHLDGGGRALIDAMQVSGRYNDASTTGYGLGLFLGRYRGLPVVSHGGGWAGYRSELLRFPEQRTSVIILANLGSIFVSELAKRVADIWLAPAFPEPLPAWVPGGRGAADLPPEVAARVTGLYQEASGDLCEMTYADGCLAAEVYGRRLSLVALGGERFAVSDGPCDMLFAWRMDGSEPTLAHTNEIFGARPHVCNRLPAFDAPPPPDAAGDYHSAELDVTYTLSLDNANLVLQRRGAPARALRGVANGMFAGRGLVLRLVRDDRGRTNAFTLQDTRSFTLQDTRVRNLRFSR